MIKLQLDKNITNKRIILREYNSNDSNSILNLMKYNWDEISKFVTPGIFNSFTLDEVKLYLNIIKLGSKMNNYIIRSIWDNSNSHLIGEVILFNINIELKKAEIGYYITKNETNKGYCSEALELFIYELFNKTFLRTLVIKCDHINHGSINVALKNGFKLTNKAHNFLYYELTNHL